VARPARPPATPRRASRSSPTTSRSLVAAGMSEARRQFRRVNGYLDLPALRVALDQTIQANITPSKEDAAA
jgi:hypothetical protein